MKRPTERDLPHWEELYREQPVEEMPWYYPDLEPDVKRTLKERNIKSGHILDLGTGPGTQAITLAKMGFKVTATDISAAAVKKARKRAKQKGVDIDFLQDNIVNTKLDGKFDYIFDRGCFHVLSSENRDDYVKNVHHLLKSGGLLFLKCFSYKEKMSGGPHHFSPSQIKKYFERHFKILSIIESVFQGTIEPLPKALLCVMKKRDAE